MKKVLFVDCCIRGENSRTKKIANFFLSHINKDYEVTHLSLMDENLSYLSGDFFEERETLIQQKQLDHPRFHHAREFAQYDKIIMAAPFWDLSFPALLKVYIENICLDGITFGCNETGCFGMCKAEELVYITTRGGCYEDSHLEMGLCHIKAMAEFWGIEKFTPIVAEGLDLGMRLPEEIIKDAEEKLLEVAKEF